MNKSISFIMCLLSAKAAIASEGVLAVKQQEITPDNFRSKARHLYKNGGQASLMLALNEIQLRESAKALNPNNGDRTPLEMAFGKRDHVLFGFFLRQGADPKSQSSKNETMFETLQHEPQYAPLMKMHAMREEVEPLVVKAFYVEGEAKSAEEAKAKFADIVAELKATKEVDPVATDKLPLNGDAAEHESAADSTTAVKAVEGEQVEAEEQALNGDSALDEHVTEEKIEQEPKYSPEGVREVLQFLKEEKLKEAQVIANLEADYNGEKRQLLIKQPGSGVFPLGVGLVVGALGTYAFFKLQDEGSFTN